MKSIRTLLLFFLFIPGLLVHSQAQDGAKPGEEKILLGALRFEDVINLPGWFTEDFLSYIPSDGYLDEITHYIDGVQIVCIMGSWCEDSRREVPRLIRVMQARNIDPSILKLYGVDRDKKDPIGEAARYGIEKVPTIIFLKNGKELGRIVERTEGRMERNILDILHPRPQQPPNEIYDTTPPQPPPPLLPPPDDPAGQVEPGKKVPEPDTPKK